MGRTGVRTPARRHPSPPRSGGHRCRRPGHGRGLLPHARHPRTAPGVVTGGDPNVEIIADDLVGRVRALKAEDSAYDIYLCGGAELAGQLVDEIGELVIKTYPIGLGSGMPMFNSRFSVTEFTLE